MRRRWLLLLLPLAPCWLARRAALLLPLLPSGAKAQGYGQPFDAKP